LYSISRFELRKIWLPISTVYSVKQVYSDSVENFIKYEKPTEKEISELYTILGKFTKEMLDYKGAEEFYVKALALKEKLYGPQSEEVANTLYKLAQLNWNDSKFEPAEKFCLKCLEIREKLYGKDHLKVAKCYNGLGELFIARDPERAKGYLEQSLQIRVAKLGEQHKLVSRTLHGLGSISDALGDHSKAAAYHLRAISIREKVLGKDHIDLSTSFLNYGISLSLLTKFGESVQAISRGLSINLSYHGEIHPSVLNCYDWLHTVYRNWGKDMEAFQFQEKVKFVTRELTLLGINPSDGDRIVD